MPIRNAGQTVRAAREKTGLTQEKFSEGICSAFSLSRIENGTAGVGPATFQALMERAGLPCESSPVFASRTDFDCFYALKHARFHLDAWRLSCAYEELNKIQKLQWANNRYYYQEWLMLHNRLQFRSGCANHEGCLRSLLDALEITRPGMDVEDFASCLLSTTEIELLTLLAQEALYTKRDSVCLSVCSQLYTHLQNISLSDDERERLLAEESIVYVKYLIATGDYPMALRLAERHRHSMVVNMQDAPLLELTYLTGLAAFHCGERDSFIGAFRRTFFSALSVQSVYATMCYQYTLKLDASCVEGDIENSERPEPVPFAPVEWMDDSTFSDGTYDPFSDEVYYIGRLIRDFRLEQKLSQGVLCQGLCSKSKLSKIENGTLQPDVFLTEALLQRLGVSERIFSFWGDAREAKIFSLRFHIRNHHRIEPDKSKIFCRSLMCCCETKTLCFGKYMICSIRICIAKNRRKRLTFLWLRYKEPYLILM